jgi:hypothetical protein
VGPLTANGSVDSITITDAGGGYASDPAPEVTISPPKPGGTQAFATATVKDGKITFIKITNAGSGYTRDSPPIVEIFAPHTGGTPATAAATSHPTREECEKELTQLCTNFCKKSCDKSVFLWMKDEANTMPMKSGSKGSCNQPCAVVRFEGPPAEECAAEFVKECEKGLNEYHTLKNAKVEHLGQGYEALERGKIVLVRSKIFSSLLKVNLTTFPVHVLLTIL